MSNSGVRRAQTCGTGEVVTAASTLRGNAEPPMDCGRSFMGEATLLTLHTGGRHRNTRRRVFVPGGMQAVLVFQKRAICNQICQAAAFRIKLGMAPPPWLQPEGGCASSRSSRYAMLALWVRRATPDADSCVMVTPSGCLRAQWHGMARAGVSGCSSGSHRLQSWGSVSNQRESELWRCPRLA